MSKSKQKTDRAQLSIFEYLKQLSDQNRSSSPPNEGRYRIVEQLRASMRAAIKDCPLSRHQIAGEMSHLLGETITKEKIDTWTRWSDEANGHPRRYIPAEHLPAFCRVTGSSEPLVIMGRLGVGDVLEFVELICYTTNHFRYSRGRNSNTLCNFRQGYSIILGGWGRS